MAGSRSLTAVAVLALVLLAGGEARPTGAAGSSTATRALPATDDGTVDSRRPAKSFGRADTLRVSTRPVRRSFLKFDVPSIDGTVTKAVLKLTATTASAAGLGVREVPDSSWSESTLRWLDAPALGRVAGTSTHPIAARQVVSVDVSRSVARGIHSFALVGRSPAGLSVGSSEQQRPALRPRLVVTYAPTVKPHGPCGFVAARPARIDHVIVIFMENKPYNAVIGSAEAPFVNQLATSCGLATNYRGVTHPSLPNYLVAVSGSHHGVEDNLPPSAHPIAAPSIFSQLRDIGKTWRSYQESAPGNCSLTSSGRYAVKHDPAPYFTAIRADCAAWDVPLGTTESGNFVTDLTRGALPSYAFVTPDLCSDTHDCSVATGDAWLQSWFAKILASPTYLAGRTVVFLTWDEDDNSASNHVPMVVVSPSTPAGTVSATPFDHYALLKTTEQLLGITTYLGDIVPSTPSLAPAFNLG